MPITKARYPIFVRNYGIFALPIENNPLYDLVPIEFVVTRYKKAIPMVLK
jgi:hypothetical protein